MTGQRSPLEGGTPPQDLVGEMLGRVRDEATVSGGGWLGRYRPGQRRGFRAGQAMPTPPTELCRGSEGCLTLRAAGLEWDLALVAEAVRLRGVHLTTRAAHGHTLRHGSERGSVRPTGGRLDHPRRRLVKRIACKYAICGPVSSEIDRRAAGAFWGGLEVAEVDCQQYLPTP